MSKFEIYKKVILITGASRGIGKAVAKAFHDKGASIILTDLSLESVEATAKGIGSERTFALAADATDKVRMEEIVKEGIMKFGGIDMVFANAGIACDPPTTIEKMNESTFERIIEVDLLGVWRTVRACLPQIISRKGHVLVTASIYAYMNGAGNAPYAMSKAGVEMFGRALRAELAGSGATSGVLYPGWVNTAIAKSAFGGNPIATKMRQMGYPGPLGWPISADKVADAVVRGVEKRNARIFIPKRWIPLSMLRGIFNMIVDAILDRHKTLHRLFRELEQYQKLK